jgi:hypothetical protein
MNLQDRDLELNWREVTCKRAVSGDNFPRGIQDFDFSVSGKNAFIPSLSYFVIDATLQVRTTAVPVFKSNIRNVLSEDQRSNINKGALFRRPSVADGVAFADHFGSTLYNNAFFRAGNSDVSLITQYIPQAGVLKSRLDKSFAWSKSIGRIVTQDDADFERRRQYVSLDGKFHDDGLKPLQYTERALKTSAGITPVGVVASTWAYNAVTGLMTYNMVADNAATANLYTTGVQVGDIIQLDVDAILTNNEYYQIIEFISGPVYDKDTYVLDGTAAPVLNFVYSVIPVRNSPSNTFAATDFAFKIWAAHDPACGFNTTQIMFQPPIGIFSEANAISGGDFKISLNPSPNYQINGVQSLRSMSSYISDNVLGDFRLVINDVKFYVATIKSDVSPTGVIPLSLVEMAVLNKTMNSGAGSQNLDFTVPPSTLAITVFVQGANAGTTTTIPSTKFYFQGNRGDTTTSSNVNGISDALIDNAANNLQQIQVTYGSITKTQTLYNSAFYNTTNEGVNKNIQRFLQSVQYSGKIVSEGGSECQPQYLERGNYWHFDFSKDKNDTSSYVNVQLGFSNPSSSSPLGQATIGEGQNLFIVAHYSRQCEISYENGFITQVISVNR